MPILEDVVARQTRVLGERHYRRGLSLRLLARALDAGGRTSDALARIGEAGTILREHFGQTHVEVAVTWSWQGLIEAHTGKLADAQRDCRAALDLVAGQRVAPRHVATLRTNAGLVMSAVGKFDEAEKHLTEAISLLRAEHLEGFSLRRALSALDAVARGRNQTVRDN